MQVCSGKTFCFRRFLLSRSLGVGNVVALGTGRMLWNMLMRTPKDLIILLRLPKRTWFLCPFPSLLFDQSCPPSNQENILPLAMAPPPLNVLVPIMEEEPYRVNECCRRSLVIHSQTCIKSNGRLLRHPYRRPARMQLISISKVIATVQDSCD